MTPTLILVMNPKTAKSVARAFNAILIPSTPKIKDLARLTQALADSKSVVGYLKTLAVGWTAPAATNIVIHPECYQDSSELNMTRIVQAKARPKAVLPVAEDMQTGVQPMDADLSKKKRIKQLEDRQRRLFQALEPFVEFGRQLNFHATTMFGNKPIFVVTENGSGASYHLGCVDATNTRSFEAQPLLRTFVTRKAFDSESKNQVYDYIPSGEVTDLTVGDFRNITQLVNSMLATVLEAEIVVPIEASEASKGSGKDQGGTQGKKAPVGDRNLGQTQQPKESGKETEV